MSITVKELTVTQCCQKFPTYSGNQGLIVVFTRAHHYAISRNRWVQSFTSCSFQRHFNIVFLFMHNFPKWCPLWIFFDQNFACIFTSLKPSTHSTCLIRLTFPRVGINLWVLLTEKQKCKLQNHDSNTMYVEGVMQCKILYKLN